MIDKQEAYSALVDVLTCASHNRDDAVRDFIQVLIDGTTPISVGLEVPDPEPDGHNITCHGITFNDPSQCDCGYSEGTVEEDGQYVVVVTIPEPEEMGFTGIDDVCTYINAMCRDKAVILKVRPLSEVMDA